MLGHDMAVGEDQDARAELFDAVEAVGAEQDRAIAGGEQAEQRAEQQAQAHSIRTITGLPPCDLNCDELLN